MSVRSPATSALEQVPTLLSLLHSPERAVIEGQLWKVVVALHQIGPLEVFFWLQDSIDLILHHVLPLIVLDLRAVPVGIPAEGPAKHPVFFTIAGAGSAARLPEHKCS